LIAFKKTITWAGTGLKKGEGGGGNRKKGGKRRKKDDRKEVGRNYRGGTNFESIGKKGKPTREERPGESA